MSDKHDAKPRKDFEIDPKFITDDPATPGRIRDLIRRYPVAVMCTQGTGGPHGSLIAFAATNDLSQLVFATPVDTKKYRLLREHSDICFVIDSRSADADRFAEVESVTAYGTATEIVNREEKRRCRAMLTAQHPYLADFISAASTALFSVKITEYRHVSRFQEIRAWSPGAGE